MIERFKGTTVPPNSKTLHKCLQRKKKRIFNGMLQLLYCTKEIMTPRGHASLNHAEAWSLWRSLGPKTKYQATLTFDLFWSLKHAKSWGKDFWGYATTTWSSRNKFLGLRVWAGANFGGVICHNSAIFSLCLLLLSFLDRCFVLFLDVMYVL